MNPNPRLRWKYAVAFAVVSTVAVEAVTVAVRFGAGHSAADFIATAPPLLMRIHHMFWCIPLLAVLPAVWQFQKTSGALLGISIGLVVSDLLHHFVVLPLTVDNTGWHWP
ncbi:MAG: hypothetical protein GX594_19185 [Pirellulaceae bacterium]|nr:hypothetical protein [Pirellulaceae bacterium]